MLHRREFAIRQEPNGRGIKFTKGPHQRIARICITTRRQVIHPTPCVIDISRCCSQQISLLHTHRLVIKEINIIIFVRLQFIQCPRQCLFGPSQSVVLRHAPRLVYDEHKILPLSFRTRLKTLPAKNFQVCLILLGLN